MMSGIIIRPTSRSDYPATEFVVREAFWNVYQPGANEHYILHLMRQWSSFLPELDFVAVDGDRIVGNVVCNHSYIESDDGRLCDTVGLGPIAVLPEYQRLGIGRRLIDRVRSTAGTMKFRAIVLFGDPNYYLARGFRAAEDYNIRTEENYYAAALMIDAWGSIGAGRYLENASQDYDAEEFRLLDSRFPLKRKFKDTPSQIRYRQVKAMRRRAGRS